jgi:hypothetical protein
MSTVRVHPSWYNTDVEISLRSYSALQGSIARMGRAMTGMDEEDSDE